MRVVGRLVATGRTSDLYEYGPGAVVKVPRAGVPAHWAAMEARFTSAVHEIGLPTPAVLGVVELDGREAVVFEFVDGESMWERMSAAPADVGPLTVELAGVHRQILSSDLPEGLPGAARRIAAKIDETDLLSDDEREEAAADAAGLPRGAALLHGDLHPGNVLMASRGPVVIDWFDASIGHPVVDIVRSAFLVRPTGHPEPREHLPGATRELLVELHHTYLEEMFDLLQCCLHTLDRWERVVAASRLSERAEPDEPVLAIWRAHGAGEDSDLERAVSAIAADQLAHGPGDPR
ncbi:MAG: aminoglycoside phosphotransferase family protein [Actinomycetota bacterium]